MAHDEPKVSGGTQEPFLSTTPSLSIIKPAPDFALRDPAGWVVHLSALRGRVVLLSFIYTSCATACPLLTQQMALLQTRLKQAGVRARSVHFLSVTVDPARDSAEALGRYAKRFAIDPGQWQFLREEPERLAPVLSAYDEWRRPLPDGDIDHPARLYLIDQRGQLREIYSLAFFDERQAFLDIRVLLREPR
jgi:protein SCO1/2